MNLYFAAFSVCKSNKTIQSAFFFFKIAKIIIIKKSELRAAFDFIFSPQFLLSIDLLFPFFFPPLPLSPSPFFFPLFKLFFQGEDSG